MNVLLDLGSGIWDLGTATCALHRTTCVRPAPCDLGTATCTPHPAPRELTARMKALSIHKTKYQKKTCQFAKKKPDIVKHQASSIKTRNRSSSRQAFKLSSRQAIKPSSHQAIKPSNRQAIKPSNRQAVKPSSYQAIKPSNHQAFKPSSYQTTRLMSSAVRAE